jgi:predicted HTH domain antitoxin
MDRSQFVQRLKEDISRDIVKKYVLLLLDALDNEPIDTKTKFMKEMFFISKNNSELAYKSDFKPDNYGPNSDYVGNVLDEFKTLQLLSEKRGKYFLTETGKDIANSANQNLNIDEKSVIYDMKNLFSGLTYNETLALVYYNYPNMTEESLVKAKIDQKREKIALNLFKKGKISSGKASEIAGMSLRSFYEFLNKKGIKMELAY